MSFSNLFQLYFDLGSPYAYLALERAEAVLGEPPELVPLLLGAIFGWRGSGSWADTPARHSRCAEVETRARHYGLPPVTWPPGWPANTLTAMRAAVWAREESRLAPFARAAFRTQFVHGRSLQAPGVLSACAEAAGLDAGELEAAVSCAAIKDELRRLTANAWAAGIRGVPTIAAGDEVFFGEDRLELAASAVAGP